MPPPLPPASPIPPLSPPLLAQKKSWWSRNWKWMVPLLAFSGIILFAGGIFGIIASASAMMKKSTPYQETVALAKRTPEVIDTLGTPITEGFLPMGNIHLNNSDGEAKLSITLKGPKAESTLSVDATKTNGVWSYNNVEVHFPETDKHLDLTPQANRASPKSPEAF